jgi:hypothetical protein
MDYRETVLFVAVSIPMLAGLALVVDAVRRGLGERQETNNDVHA